MTFKEIEEFFYTRRESGNYGVIDEHNQLIAVLLPDFDLEYLALVIKAEFNDNEVKIKRITDHVRTFEITIEVQIFEKEPFVESKIFLCPVNIYSSDSIKHIVNSIQQDNQ